MRSHSSSRRSCRFAILKASAKRSEYLRVIRQDLGACRANGDHRSQNGHEPQLVRVATQR